MKTSIDIEIEAPPRLVFDLARDVTRWPRLLPHYLSATLERHEGAAAVVRFVARRPLQGPLAVLGLGIPVVWRSRTWSEPEGLRLRFVHLGGATRGMDVTWRIEPVSNGERTRVTIHHDFRAPGAWARFVDRFFTRPIAGRTLATFRDIAEASHQSARPHPANTSP
jgi:aromatase